MNRNIICLCGSTKFKKEFEQALFDLSVQGNIVLSVCCFAHADNITLTPEQKETVDKLHFSKIELANEIFVINVGRYVGDSTKNEIKHATALGKKISYLEPI
jgi:hypothetical protein